MTTSNDDRWARSADPAVRDDDALFRATFDYAAIGMAIVGLDGRFLEVNPALCEIVGRSQTELLATDFQSLTHPDDLNADLDAVKRLHDGDIRSYQMEKRYYHEDGHVVWILLSVSLVRDDAGAPLYFLSQIQDISERKAAESELFRKNQEVHAALDLAPDCVASFDRELRYVYVNSAQAELCALPREDFPGKSNADLPTPADVSIPFDAKVREVFESGEPGELEIAVTTPTGIRVYHVRLAPVCDARGDVERVISVGRDVTDVGDATRRLRAAEERFDLAMRGANDGIWDWRAGDDEVYYSDRCAEILGYSPAEYSRRSEDWKSLVHPKDVDRVMKAFQAHLHGETDFFYAEYRMRTKQGPYRWVLDRARVVRDEAGNATRMVGSRTEIDARKRLEADLEGTRLALAARVGQLEAALAEVRELRGILPMCSYCKSVRDDENYWIRVEEYLGRHTDAQFSHGICPTCYDREIVPQIKALRARSSPPTTSDPAE